MSKEKYQFYEKFIWLSLSIIDHDLRCFDKELSTTKGNLEDLIS